MTDPLDIFSPAAAQNPYPVYERLRQQAPLHYDAVREAWIVSRYADVTAALKQVDAMSSRLASFETILLGADPPAHTHVRSIVSRVFPQPAAVTAVIRAMATDLTAAMAARGGGDLVADFAVPLPLAVICQILGLEEPQLGDLRRWSDAVVNSSIWTDESADERRQVEETRREFDAFLADYVQFLERHPNGGLLSRLLAAAPDARLSLEEIAIVGKFLIIAGNETTRNLIASAAFLLFTHAGALERIRDRPELIADGVDEVLRYESPVQGTQRLATRPLALAGGEIREGARVLLLLGSANRDPEQFAEPEQFILDRKPARHLAFGHGPHFCLGAQLARIESAIAIETLFDRVRRVAPAGELRDVRFRTFQTRGPERLDVVFS